MNRSEIESSAKRLRPIDWAAFVALTVAPVVLYAPALFRGEIPLSMDTVMYFLPLKWHAGRLIGSADGRECRGAIRPSGVAAAGFALIAEFQLKELGDVVHDRIGHRDVLSDSPTKISPYPMAIDCP